MCLQYVIQDTYCQLDYIFYKHIQENICTEHFCNIIFMFYYFMLHTMSSFSAQQ